MESAPPSLANQESRLRVIAFLLFAGYSWILLRGASGLPDVAMAGALFLLAVAGSFFVPRRICSWFWLTGGLFLLIVHGVNWLASDRGIGMFLEHASQVGLPLLLFLLVRGAPDPLVTRLALGMITFTFVFHGLFALGLSSSIPFLDHGTPDHFLFMTRACLGLESNATALVILKTVGILDLLAAAAIWIPVLRGAGLVYMVLWGFLTALARPVAHVEMDSLAGDLFHWFPEFLARTPHWGIPLALLGWPNFACCRGEKTESSPHE